jgi:hypothetical protein
MEKKLSPVGNRIADVYPVARLYTYTLVYWFVSKRRSSRYGYSNFYVFTIKPSEGPFIFLR